MTSVHAENSELLACQHVVIAKDNIAAMLEIERIMNLVRLKIHMNMMTKNERFSYIVDTV